MIDRRQLITSGLAIPAVSLAGGFGLPLSARAASLDLEQFLYDPRFAEAYDMAQRMKALGVATTGIADNLMDYWYDELDLRWKDGPMALAGVTMKEALFVLETFALDRRMRVVYRGEHAPAEDGAIKHMLKGPADMLEGFSSLPQDTNWLDALSLAMTQCPLGAPEAEGGGYYGPQAWGELKGPVGPASTSVEALRPDPAARLWAVSEDLVASRGIG